MFLQSKNISEELLKPSEPTILSNVGCWLVRRRWRVAPWEDVPMGGDRWPDNTSLRHYSVLQRPPTTPHTNNQRHNADVSVASLLVLGHQLLLDPQPHPGARAGLVGQVSFSGSGSQDDVFLTGTPPCTVTLTLKVKSFTPWNGTRWVYLCTLEVKLTFRWENKPTSQNNHKHSPQGRSRGFSMASLPVEPTHHNLSKAWCSYWPGITLGHLSSSHLSEKHDHALILGPQMAWLTRNLINFPQFFICIKGGKLSAVNSCLFFATIVFCVLCFVSFISAAISVSSVIIMLNPQQLGRNSLKRNIFWK